VSRIALCAVALVMVAGPAGAQAPRAAQASLRVGVSSMQDTTRRRGVSGPEIALGIAGSAVGMWGGALAGLGVYDLGGGCTRGCEDPGLGEGAVGLVVGSIVGTAVGTGLGAKLAHRRPGSFGRRLMAGGVGLLAGLAAFELVGHDADQALPLIAFPVAQGVVGALLGRAR
jgi:hypothetical protein